MNGFHIESMTEDERNFLGSAKIYDPIPGEETFYADDNIDMKRFNSG
jgi:hypothetical protein